MFILDEYSNTWNYTFVIVAVIALIIGAFLEMRRMKKARQSAKNKKNK